MPKLYNSVITHVYTAHVDRIFGNCRQPRPCSRGWYTRTGHTSRSLSIHGGAGVTGPCKMIIDVPTARRKWPLDGIGFPGHLFLVIYQYSLWKYIPILSSPIIGQIYCYAAVCFYNIIFYVKQNVNFVGKERSGLSIMGLKVNNKDKIYFQLWIIY